jgi:hypothetical protein
MPSPINFGGLSKPSANPITNATINTVIFELTAYNSLASASVPNKPAMLKRLDAALVACGTWLTAKPPRTTTTNAGRWFALRKIAKDISKAIADLGYIKLQGEFDASGDLNYTLERIDPSNRPGFILGTPYQTWLTNGPDGVNFFTYMDTVADAKVKQGKALQDALNLNEVAPVLDETTVKQYQDEIKKSKEYELHVTMLNDLQRVQYRVTPDSGELKDIHGRFCTKHHKTHFSGNGWAIFVVAPGNVIYSFSHERGKFHHSTFLAGGTVNTAGELVVNEYGQVQVITGKSGHYRPEEKSVWSFVVFLGRAGVLGSSAVVRPGFTSGWARAGDYANRKFNAPVLTNQQAYDSIPTWARSNRSIAAFNGDNSRGTLEHW